MPVVVITMECWAREVVGWSFLKTKSGRVSGRHVRQSLRYLYNLVPWKTHVFGVLRETGVIPPHLYTRLTVNGIVRVSMPSKQAAFKMMSYGDPLETDLFWTGYGNGREATSLRVWECVCHGAKTILDVGANTGLYALAARAVNSSARVYAFEPVTRVYRRLCENVALNDFAVCAEPWAVSDTDAEVQMYEGLGANPLSSSLDPTKIVTSKQVSVRAVRLDSYLVEKGVSDIDLLKIDVELHEPSVIRGLGRYLRDNLPIMLVEVLRDQCARELNVILDGIEYEYYRIVEGRGVVRIGKVEAGVPGSYNVLICRPGVVSRTKLAEFVV